MRYSQRKRGFHYMKQTVICIFCIPKLCETPFLLLFSVVKYYRIKNITLLE